MTQRARGAGDPPREPTLALASKVPAQADGRPLLDYLRQRFPYHDEATWRREIASGRLEVDGVPAEPTQRLRHGQQLVYHKVHREPKVDRGIGIVHDDASIVVASKPAHLPMHADGPFVRHTFVHILRERLALPALHLVHRLDRETSGLCVVAKTAAARVALDRQFSTGAVAKAYLAIVRGALHRDFTVDAPIGHAADSIVALRRSAHAAARDVRPAHTGFHVLATGADRTLLRCVPRTGRTHQIRVHLEHAGCPLLGDKLYGRPDADYLAFVARVKAGGDARDVADGEPDRQLLHAAELGFLHPTSGEPMHFTSALPADFTPWLADIVWPPAAPAP